MAPVAQERDGIVQLLETRGADNQSFIRDLENRATTEHDAYRTQCEQRFMSERRELERVQRQCGEGQERIDTLIKSEAIMAQHIERLQTEARSGGYPATEAVAETSERLYRSQIQIRDLERQLQEARLADKEKQKNIGTLQTAFTRFAEQLAAKALQGPSGADADRLRTELQERKRISEAYREQRDKLQADWDAWECHAGDTASLYGTVQSEASFNPTGLPLASIAAARRDDKGLVAGHSGVTPRQHTVQLLLVGLPRAGGHRTWAAHEAGWTYLAVVRSQRKGEFEHS